MITMCSYNNNMQIKIQQQRDSVRLVWNALPSNKTLSAKAAIPQALHYTILDHNEQNYLAKDPPRCHKCSAFMNPYNRIHLDKTSYNCCICKEDNKVPANYFEDSNKLPDQLTLEHSSYLLARHVPLPFKLMAYLFVIDITVEEKQLEAIKKAVLELIDSLEEQRIVGLITYDKYVNLYDLGSIVPSIIKIPPKATYDESSLLNMLFLNRPQDIKQRYLMRFGQCKATLIERIKNLTKVKHKVFKNERQHRAVGQALNMAISASDLLKDPTRIIFFCGGVCTSGHGKIIDNTFTVQMRSISESLPTQSRQALRFFVTLGQKIKMRNIVIDSFIFSVEQVGLTEMLPCLKATGGLLVQHEQFDSEIFRQSFRKAYIPREETDALIMATDTQIEIKNSPEIVVTSFQDISKQLINKYHNRFRLNNLTETSTVTVGFEQKQGNTNADAFYIQIISNFRDANNLDIIIHRITTIRRPFVPTSEDLISSFDQEAALHYLTKMVIEKSQQEKNELVRVWLDNVIIKWASLFGTYKKGDTESFRLPETARLLPQYMYYLRRNAIMRKNRISLDEYSYMATLVKHQKTLNVLLMIQPAILSYTPEDTSAQPVTLDERHMMHESILLLDSYLNVVEWRGKNINSWFEQNYQESENYAYLQEINQNLTEDVKNIKNSRFPTPCIYLTYPGHSKERFLKSRLCVRDEEPEEGNLSEEADINAFTSMLIHLVVGK